jgi:hypothetical protein
MRVAGLPLRPSGDNMTREVVWSAKAWNGARMGPERRDGVA